MTIKSTETRCWFISSTELTNPTIDTNPTSLILLATPCSDVGFMSIVGFVNSVELMKYIPAPCFRTFYSHVLKPTSLFRLEEMFLLSLFAYFFKGRG